MKRQVMGWIRSLGLATGIVLLFGMPGAQAAAAEESAGDAASFPALSLTDQHDDPVELPGTARWVLFANSKEGDQWAASALEPIGRSGMAARRLLYLSDISAMPSLITRMFAMPALRKREYPVALIREEGKAAGIPARADCLSLIGLDAGRIARTEYLCTADAVRQALQALPSAQ
jgi:hypothetical protein